MYTTTADGKRLVAHALHIGALELIPGGRILKSGRVSPYFFNSGLFVTAQDLAVLASAYVSAMQKAGFEFDVIFGPAYKGISLAATITMALAQCQPNTQYAYNRKEPKEHGEGGGLVGASMLGRRVAIVDDVITDGATKIEAVDTIRDAGGIPTLLVVAFDRMERAVEGGESASQIFSRRCGFPVMAAANILDLIEVLRDREDKEMLAAVEQYRRQYGVA